MSYKTIADMAEDESLKRRIIACAYQEQIPPPYQSSGPLGNITVRGDSKTWVDKNIVSIVAAPGWGAAWDSAVASMETIPDPDGEGTIDVRAIPDPGSHPAVISDGMILAAVQSLVASA